MLINDTYGNWTILSKDNVGTKKHYRVKAKCVCGKEKHVLVGHLNAGKSDSCGCVRSRTHGMSFTPEYCSWGSMRSRCLNPNNSRFHQYGGRGITICEEWRSFEQFLQDMGPRPPGTTLGRIDNDGPYCKTNCRWETRKQQMRNRSVTFKVAGESVDTVAESIGMKACTLATRIKRGWNEHEAIETPVFRKEETVTHIAKQMGLAPHTVDSRVRRGWSVDKALSTPIKPRKELKSIAEQCGIPAHILCNRLLRGWSMERATTQPVREVTRNVR